MTEVTKIDSFDTGQDQQDRDGEPSDPSWRFMVEKFWLFSHAFTVFVTLSCVLLGLWQLDRLSQRREQNELIERQIDAEPVRITAVSQLVDEDLEFRPATLDGEFVDEDFARVVNRSSEGVAGEYVVALFALVDGGVVVVNRGFVPVNIEVELSPAPQGQVQVVGWLQESVIKERLGATDNVTSTKMPRLDLSMIERRLGDDDLAGHLETSTVESDLADYWLQQQSGGSGFPAALPAPAIDEGPHLSYAVQWFTFAALGAVVYFAILRRKAFDASRKESAPSVA